MKKKIDNKQKKRKMLQLWTFHADTYVLPEHSPQNKPDNFCLTDTGLEEAMRV